MKQIYKQLTKVLGLVALFLMIGSNAWASITWSGTKPASFPASGYCDASTWYPIDNTGISVNGPKIQYSSTIKSIDMGYVKAENDPRGTFGHLKSDATKFVTFVFQSYKEAERVIIAEESTGFKLETAHSEGYTTTTGEGVSVTFQMQAGLEYEVRISSTNTPHLKSVIVYTDAEVLSLKDSDEKSTNNSAVNSGTNKKVLALERTLKAGIWNTFCLPMTLNAEQLNIANEVYTLSSYNSSTNELTFAKSTTLPANTPCLIKPEADVVNPAFAGTIVSVNENSLTNSDGNIKFVGVYGKEHIYTTGNASSTKFFLRNTDNKLVYPTSDSGNNGWMKGFRAYFEATGALVKDMSIIFDDTATGIIKVENDIFQENGRVYSIDGRYVGDSKENLSRGIYIQNGRKFIVK